MGKKWFIFCKEVMDLKNAILEPRLIKESLTINQDFSVFK